MSKKRSLQLSIETPCEQDWGEMKATAGGRDCAHCNTLVVDFTQMSDAQLLNYFSRNGVGCGRFREDQLNQPILSCHISRPNWFGRLAIGALLILGLHKESDAQSGTNKARMEKHTISRHKQDSANRLPNVSLRQKKVYTAPIIDSEYPSRRSVIIGAYTIVKIPTRSKDTTTWWPKTLRKHQLSFPDNSVKPSKRHWWSISK